MDFRKNRSIYLQIADLIGENILKERWPAGERVPSIRELAVELEVNPNTVMRTFSFLQESGIIYNRRGLGYFVSDEGKTLTLEWKRKDFMDGELIHFFHLSRILEIDVDKMSRLYTDYLEKNR